MDAGRWGPGEGIVFGPYTRRTFEEAQAWIAGRDIFPGGALGRRDYAEAVLTLPAG